MPKILDHASLEPPPDSSEPERAKGPGGVVYQCSACGVQYGVPPGHLCTVSETPEPSRVGRLTIKEFEQAWVASESRRVANSPSEEHFYRTIFGQGYEACEQGPLASAVYHIRHLLGLVDILRRKVQDHIRYGPELEAEKFLERF